MIYTRIFSTAFSYALVCLFGASALNPFTPFINSAAASMASATNAQIARSQEPPGVPPTLKEVGISEHLGDRVAIQDLHFKDEKGADVKLADYFHKGRPVILNLVYFECPNLCSLVLNGFVKSLKSLEWMPGKDFEILTVSIDPKEGPELAAGKKEAYLASYGRPAAAAGWHFLTGRQDQIQALAKQVGFAYKYVPEEQQFAHSAAIFALTPEGKISRYLYGIDFPTREMKLALVEASNGKVGTMVDRFLLFCYRYDSTTHKYSVYLSKVMQAATGGTVVVFGGYLAVFWQRQRKLTDTIEADSDRKREG